ncbi:MAG: LysR family transcriptional regulator substrate-binding protein, partial [Clostridia bacterium]|nr:LysR family transcriptional regulator substrate-binding protein [Clostridia bacterium]
EDLLNTPLLMSQRALVQNEWANWFGGCYEKLHIVATYNLLYNAAMLVQNGMGAALCLRLETEYEGLRFLPLRPGMETRSVLVWKKSQAQTPAAAAFIAFVQAYMKGMKCDCL